MNSQGAMLNSVCLSLENLSKNFAGLNAVNQVNLTVRQGERKAILGPNGAGKTTLFNLISGESRPSSGKIFLFGQDITKMPANRRAYLGISRTFQITNLFPQLSILDNLILAAQALEKTKFCMFRPITSFKHLYRRVDDILAKVGMIDKREKITKNLSYGEQRQIEVAMALLGAPRLLLLDEPTAGLAPAESAIMVSMIKNLDKEITILMIEHDMDVAFEIADQVTVLNFGEVLAEGTKEDIQADDTIQRIYLGLE